MKTVPRNGTTITFAVSCCDCDCDFDFSDARADARAVAVALFYASVKSRTTTVKDYLAVQYSAPLLPPPGSPAAATTAAEGVVEAAADRVVEATAEGVVEATAKGAPPSAELLRSSNRARPRKSNCVVVACLRFVLR